MAICGNVRVWITREEQVEAPELFHRILSKMQEVGVVAADQKRFLKEWYDMEPGGYGELYRRWVTVVVRKRKDGGEDEMVED